MATPRRTTIWLSVSLIVLTVAVFAPVRHFDFVSWDDPLYVSENPVVSQGLTGHGVVWALTSPGGFYWHPLTWVSHMFDVEMFGMRPGAHHVMNLLLHIASTLLLFWVLQRTTGLVGASALVAALFAVHPLRVESVAWIAERKDVLGGLFWMLTLWAYVAYVRAPGRARYARLLGLFALGLMAKPTLVTLPFVLLLLDAWPLRRIALDGSRPPFGAAQQPWSAPGIAPLVLEKVPLFALSVAASVVTFFAQFHVGAVQGLETVPVGERLSNAVVACVTYIRMALWPARLAAFYPYRPLPGWWVLCCLLGLVGVSYAALRLGRHRPYVLVGWLWYLVTLLPVIGLIQVGSQSMADRFTYIPLIGLFIILAWGAADLAAPWRHGGLVAGAAALAVVGACACVARPQVQYWRDSETLWRHAVEVVPNNDLAHANLGLVLAIAGRADEALAHFSEALRIVAAPDGRAGTGRGEPPPEYAELLHNQLGLLLGRQGRWKEAIPHFREVVRLRAGSADAHYALGQALGSDGQLDEGIRESLEAIRLEPGRAEFHGDLGSLLYRARNLEGAIGQLEEAVRLGPTHRSRAKWHYNLGAMLHEVGRTTDALRHLEAALAINPAYEDARRAWNDLNTHPR